MTNPKSLILLSILLSGVLSTSAQWQQTNGPRGGLTSCFASDSDEIYAGTYLGGIFRSDNEGASWTACNNDLVGLGVGALYTENETVYAGTGTNGLYHSEDDGASWESYPGFWSSYSLTCIASQGDQIYIGNSGSGFMVSHDGGQTWATAMNGILPYIYYAAQKLLIRDDKLFGLVNGRIYVSTDNADTWNLSDAGLPEYGASSIVSNGPNMMATTNQGFYASTDEGVSWFNIPSNLPPMPYGVFITSAGNHIYVSDAYYDGVYFSDNNGYDWTEITFPPENSIMGIYALADGKLLAQTTYTSTQTLTNERAALYLTTDNGNAWNDITHEIIDTYCMSLAVRDDQVFVGTNGTGIFSTDDEGENWSGQGVVNANLRTMHVAGNTVLAAGDIGVKRTTDNGVTWTNGNQGLTNVSIQGFAHIDDNIFAATADGVFISTDDGLTWQQQNNGITTPGIAAVHAIGTTLYAGTMDGIFISTNYGNSWSSISNGLPDASTVYAVDHINNTLVIVVMNYGIYISQDNGINWVNINTNFAANTLEVVGNIIFAGTAPLYDITQTGIIMTSDLGATWQDANQGLTNNIVWDMAVAGDYIYACTKGSGVFKRPLTDFISENISEEISENISIYPNPTTDNITINIPSSLIGSVAIITNELGQEVMKIGNVNSTNFQVNCSSLATGFYVVKIGGEKVKLVVQ